MSTLKKINAWALGALFVLAAFGSQVKAATSDTIDIHVSITGNKSVTITGTTYYDFGALAVNSSSVSATAITVTNNSTVFIETYTVTGADAISDTGGTNWALEAASGADDYALAAQFSTAPPADDDGAWAADSLSTGASTCSATAHGNGTEGEGGSNVEISGARSLWFRIKTPTSVTDSSQHNITNTVSVL